MKKILILLILTVTVSCYYPGVEEEPFTCYGFQQAEYSIADVDSTGVVEGDILVDFNRGVVVQNKLWPDAVIPFYFAADYPEENREVVREAVRQINENTVLQVVEYSDKTSLEKDYENGIIIKYHFVNSSYVGMQGGIQSLNLSAVTEYYIPVHEFLHASGMHHEQNRADRDKWIDIHWENMDEYYHKQYNTYLERGEDGVDCGAELDFNSIMIYGSYKTSNNEEPVMTRKDGTTWGTNKVMSEQDILTINTVYEKRAKNRK